eukprot:s604_g12.t1
MPCRHAVLCERCLEVLMERTPSTCPVCRQRIQNHARGHFVDDYVELVRALEMRMERSQMAAYEGMYNHIRPLMVTGALLATGAAACFVVCPPAAPALLAGAGVIGDLPWKCVEAELSLHHTDGDTWAAQAERVFLALFTVEILLRVVGLGMKNLTNVWFYMDFLLVGIGLLARVVIPISGAGSLAGFETLLLVRCLRLLRLVRALRMISHFKVMWRLVYSLLTAGQTMLSTTVLILLALFIFGCVALEFITKDQRLSAHPETGPIVTDFFSSLPRAILTLTQFVTLDSIAAVYYPLIVHLDSIPLPTVFGSFTAALGSSVSESAPLLQIDPLRSLALLESRMEFAHLIPPLAVEEWFQAMPEVLTSVSWSLALARPKAQLWHRSCPWGGHLIKFDTWPHHFWDTTCGQSDDLKGIQIRDAPEKTGNLIVRPEVRAVASGVKGIGVRFQCSIGLFRRGDTFRSQDEHLFERSKQPRASPLYFFHDALCPVAVHQKVRRDFPSEGDSAIAFWQGGQTFHGFMAIRPETTKGEFNVVFAFRIMQDKFASWATFQFRKVLEGVYNTTQWFLNRPNIQKLREIDEKFYVVLSIQSFKRGLPMIPCSSEPLVTIDAGERLGLPHWRRYKRQQEHNPRKSKFHLVEYIKMLLNAIGEDWGNCLQGNRFAEVFPLAKAAYRRANGGTYAPSLHEDAEAKFNPQEQTDKTDGAEHSVQPEQSDATRLVVRNTFLDLEDCWAKSVHECQEQR